MRQFSIDLALPAVGDARRYQGSSAEAGLLSKNTGNKSPGSDVPLSTWDVVYGHPPAAQRH